MTTPESSQSAQELEETMHFFRQYAASVQMETFADAKGWGIHPESHEYNILGCIALGDRRPSVDILPEISGLRGSPDLEEVRRTNFGPKYDKTLVEVGAERFEKDVMLYFRQLGAQFAFLKQGIEREQWEEMFFDDDNRSHSDYVHLAVVTGDKKDSLDILQESIEQLGGSRNLEARMRSFQNQRADQHWISLGRDYDELLGLTHSELVVLAEKQDVFTKDCGSDGFTVEDFIWRSN